MPHPSSLTSRRPLRGTRFAGVLLAVIIGACALLVVWPQTFGLSRMLPFAQLISFRMLGVIGIAAALLFVLLLMISRRMRAVLTPTALVIVTALIAASAVIMSRGIADSSTSTGQDGAVHVVSWNTRGDEPGSPTIASLAIENHADVVVLPETTQDMVEEVASLMSEQGSTMQVFAATTAEGYGAASTSVLVSETLGTYAMVDGPSGTQTLATVAVAPLDGDGPRIVAAHAVAPTPSRMQDWRDDLEWLSTQCTDNTIMAGDFNATLDHFAGLGQTDASGGLGDLGACHDAALAAGAASLGTWTSGKPPLLVPAIDHILASTHWRTSGFTVVRSDDRAGSDHRPIVAELVPTS